MSIRILALDVATKTGAAYGPSDGTPTSWTWKLKTPDDTPTRAARRLGIELRDFLTASTVDLIVVEAPIAPGAITNTNANTIRLLHGLSMVVHGIAGPYGIRCEEANVQTVRKRFLGVARPADPKAAVLAQCKSLCWLDSDCRDDNRADALALWSFAASQYGGHLGVIAHAAGARS